MTNEEKQALIYWAHKWLEPARRMAQSNPNDESAQASLQLYEIALSALTAQPVKPPQRYDAHGFQEPAHVLNSRWIEAIRMAGYEVQE